MRVLTKRANNREDDIENAAQFSIAHSDLYRRGEIFPIRERTKSNLIFSLGTHTTRYIFRQQILTSYVMDETQVEQLELRGAASWGRVSFKSSDIMMNQSIKERRSHNFNENKMEKSEIFSRSGSFGMKIKTIICRPLNRLFCPRKTAKTIKAFNIVILIMVLCNFESRIVKRIDASRQSTQFIHQNSTREANNSGATRESGSEIRDKIPQQKTRIIERFNAQNLYGFLDRTTESKMDEFMRWLVDELVQMGASNYEQKLNGTTHLKVIHRVHRNKRSSGNRKSGSNTMHPDAELISQNRGAQLKVKSYNPNAINVTHMAMRAGLDAKAIRKPRRHPATTSPMGLAEMVGVDEGPEVTSPSPSEVSFEDPTPIDGNVDSNSQAQSNGGGGNANNFDDNNVNYDTNKETKSSNENNIDHQIDELRGEVAASELNGLNKSKSRRKSQNLTLDPTSPTAGPSNSLTVDTPSSIMLTSTKRIPPPEHNPFKSNKTPPAFELMDDDRPQVISDGAAVPQVGDQSILDNDTNNLIDNGSGNKRTASNNVNINEEQLLRDQIRLNNLIKDYENELANKGAALQPRPQSRVKRPSKTRNNLYEDHYNLDPSVNEDLGLQPKLVQMAEYPRTRAPYVATGGNIDNLYSYQPEPQVGYTTTRDQRNFTLPRVVRINPYPPQATGGSNPASTLTPRATQTNIHPLTKQRQDYTHQLEENFYNINYPDQSTFRNQQQQQPLVAPLHLQMSSPPLPPPASLSAQINEQDRNGSSLVIGAIAPVKQSRSKLKASASRQTPNFANPSSRFIYNQQLDGYSLMPNTLSGSTNGAQNNGFFGILKAVTPGPAASALVANHQALQQPVRRTAALWTNQQQAYANSMPSLPTAAYIIPSSTQPLSGYGGFNGQPPSSVWSQYQRAQALHSAAPIKRQMMGSSSATHLNYRMGGSARYGSQLGFDEPSGSQSSSPATADPMWASSQHHQQQQHQATSQEDEYQQAPQTIQITAVPNGLGGFNGLNGVNGWAGGLGGWNGWGNNPWNGRQVLLVNRQPQANSEWRQWALPIAIILALPLILGALFVPVFLKSVMFLIQILQMLGLLMPPGQLAGHLAASAHNASTG